MCSARGCGNVNEALSLPRDVLYAMSAASPDSRLSIVSATSSEMM